MRRSMRCIAVAAGVAAAACVDNATSPAPPAPPSAPVSAQQSVSSIKVFKTRQQVAADLAAAKQGGHGGGGGGGGGTGIVYHGGPILYQTKVAAIYWGTSTIYTGGPTPGTTGSGSQDGSLVGFFLRNLGGSPYFNINTTYYDGTSTHVQNVIAYTQFWADNTAPGATVSDAQIQAEVAKGLSSGALTYDASTLYHVFTGPGVNLGGGFGTQYCAYHGHFTWNGLDVKYSAMPHDYDFPTACAALNGSPNDDFAADAEVNTLAHETEETTTDEDLNAWYDRRGYENADKCAWTFGTEYTVANGSKANMKLGTRDYLIQQNWVNASGGYCAMSY